MAVARREEIRADMPTDIPAVLVILDLDDLGAEIGELLRTERPGAILFDRDDAETREWLVYAGFRAMICLAMMMRCSSLVPSPIVSSGASR
nr:hypothetical protein [Sphingomonas sp. CFBP 8765]